MKAKLVGFLGILAVCSLLTFAAPDAVAQGTTRWTVTFDGRPYIPRGTAVLIPQYFEGDMWFRAIGGVPPSPPYYLGRSGGGEEGFPENGTAYLVAALDGSLAVSSVSGLRFSLVAVDLAEFSTLYQTPATVRFVGYKADGSTVTTNLVTDGIIDGLGPLADFQTFYFDSRFADVVRVEVPTYGWSLDNMVFADVPEPGIWALLVAGATAWATGRRRGADGEGGF